MASYTIRAVDGSDKETAKIIIGLHGIVLPGELKIDPAKGQWWLAYRGEEPIAFAGVRCSTHLRRPQFGYLERAGVLPRHRGRGLHRRLIRVREAFARRAGWAGMVTDTANNPDSANNFVRLGYSIFAPKNPWGLRSSIYWRKEF